MAKYKYRIITDNRLGYSVEVRWWWLWHSAYGSNSFSSSTEALDCLKEFKRDLEFKPQVIYEE